MGITRRQIMLFVAGCLVGLPANSAFPGENEAIRRSDLGGTVGELTALVAKEAKEEGWNVTARAILKAKLESLNWLEKSLGERLVIEKTDADLADEKITTIIIELVEAEAKGAVVTVYTFEGLVTLKGRVTTFNQRNYFGKLAEGIKGVKAVTNDLQVARGLPN